MTTTTKETFTQIFTQVHENYGAHSWDGEGEVPNHWKAKGGTTFVLEADVDVDAFIKAISSESDYFTEEVIGQNVVEDPYENTEGWDQPTFVKKAADGFLLDVTETSEYRAFHPKIRAKKSIKQLSLKGLYTDFVTVYTTADGEMIPASKMDAWLKENK